MRKIAVHRCAFTLIEVLVVIGIIGVLMAILLPVTEKVRHKGYIDACASNLRQLGQALNMYANENHGYYPRTIYDPAAAYTAGTGATSPDPFVPPAVSPNDLSAPIWLLARAEKLPTKILLCPYNDVNEFEPDPARPEKQANFTNYKKNLGFSYANPYPSAAAVLAGYKLTSRLPASFAVMADLNPGINPNRRSNPFVPTPQSPRSVMVQGNSDNHEQEGQNVLFADGHVSYEITPFVGPNNDNIYTAQNAVAPNFLLSPVGPGDCLLLPTD